MVDAPNSDLDLWKAKFRNALAFDELPPGSAKTLFERFEPIDVAAGDAIIRQGETGDYYYLIDRGDAKVTRQMFGKENPVELAALAAGACFGEEALISGKPRNATVTMATDGRLWRLSKKEFVELLKDPLLRFIDVKSALAQLNDNAVFLDVRVSSEFKAMRLPNAVNIPVHDIRGRLRELDRGTHYICYCNSGGRSAAASFVLRQQGFQSSVLAGGLQSVPANQLISTK